MKIRTKTFSLALMLVFLIPIFFSSFHQIAFSYSEAPNIITNSLYYIKNKNSGKYLTVTNNSDTNGANVVQAYFTADKGQQWKVIHLGDGIYKITSEVGSKTRVLDVYSTSNQNGVNVDIWIDTDSSEKRFQIIRNNDGYSYRIASKCSNFSKVITVSEASCLQNANVFQYQYNASGNDEWLFEPIVNYSTALAVNYATINYNKRVPTYPNIDYLGGDCANFVSQCMVAGGVHYQNDWWVYKTNNNNPSPNTSTKLDNSWLLSDPSPWISAYEFNRFWSERVTTETYSSEYIVNNPSVIYYRPFYVGDVVQILDKNFYGEPSNAWHTMFITSYGSYNNQPSFRLTYHSNDICNKSLLEIANQYKDSYFKFFRIN